MIVMYQSHDSHMTITYTTRHHLLHTSVLDEIVDKVREVDN